MGVLQNSRTFDLFIVYSLFKRCIWIWILICNQPCSLIVYFMCTTGNLVYSASRHWTWWCSVRHSGRFGGQLCIPQLSGHNRSTVRHVEAVTNFLWTGWGTWMGTARATLYAHFVLRVYGHAVPCGHLGTVNSTSKLLEIFAFPVGWTVQYFFPLFVINVNFCIVYIFQCGRNESWNFG